MYRFNNNDKRRIRISCLFTAGIIFIWMGDFLIWKLTGLVANTPPASKYRNYVGFVLPMALAICALLAGLLGTGLAIYSCFKELQRMKAVKYIKTHTKGLKSSFG